MMIPVRHTGRAKAMEKVKGPAVPVPPRIPRVTRLMALAIKFQDMVDRGEVRDYADLARLGHVTRARISQIMNLLLLAPEFQSTLLFPNWRPDADDMITERDLRSIIANPMWADQRVLVAERFPGLLASCSITQRQSSDAPR
jgi:hypothetical protein